MARPKARKAMERTFEEMQTELRQWAKARGLRKERNRDEYSLFLTGADEECEYAGFHFDMQLLKAGIYNARILANGFSGGSLSARVFGMEGAYDDNDMELCLANVLTLGERNTPSRCLELAIENAENAICLLTGAEWSDWLKWHYGIGHFLKDLKRVLNGENIKAIVNE